MAELEFAEKRPEHPWLSEFEADPSARLDEMLRGVALIKPYGLADPQTVLPSLFGPMDDADPLRTALDQELADWLERYRELSHSARRCYGIKSYVSDVTVALSLVQQLFVPITRNQLRDKYIAYLRWTEPLVLSNARDPRARFWLALTVSQSNLHFRDLWHRVCRKTGEGVYPPHYLGVGLQGLRGLPLDEREVLKQVLGGLGAWASNLEDNHSNKQAFVRQWRTLQWLYTQPGRSAWRRLTAPVLEAHQDKPFAAWWREGLGYQAGHGPGSGKSGRVHEPDIKEVDRLIDRIDADGPTRLMQQIRTVVDYRRAWAEQTGDSHHLVFTVSRIASHVLENDAAQTEQLVVEGLEWAPFNPYLWHLWARAAVSQGHVRMGEAIFWETLRRFPDNAPTYAELGRLLISCERLDEAEALLQQIVRQAPEHDQTHVELARLMGRQGRFQEATTLLELFLERVRDDNEIAINVLGHLWINWGQPEPAKPLLRRLEQLGSARPYAELHAALTRAEAGEQVKMPQPHHLEDSQAGAAEDRQAWSESAIEDDARVTRADYGLSAESREYVTAERREQFIQDLKRLANKSANHAYAQLVLLDRCDWDTDTGREMADQMLGDFPALYELRLAVALHHQDGDALRRLQTEEPKRRQITGLALIALNDSADREIRTVCSWVAEQQRIFDDPLAAYVHRALRNLVESKGVTLSDYDAVAKTFEENGNALLGILNRATRMVQAYEIAA